MSKRPHIPIMEEEMVRMFADSSLKVFVDGTLGAGGHAKRILQEHPEIELFLGFDQDPEALMIAKETLSPWKDKVQLIHANFVELDQELNKRGIKTVDGFFFDLGVSSMQLDRDYKGFSFSKEGPLDMRMNPLNELSAREIVNEWSEKELGDVFREYGEDPRWKAAAKAIVQERKKGPITTTTQLASLLCQALKTKTRGRLHPATLVFQALRICVNKELEVLEEALGKVVAFLAPKGTVGVMSFHSFEDRIVKQVFKTVTKPIKEHGKKVLPVMELLTKKPLVPTLQEILDNPRSRSAKLRFLRRN